MTLDQLRIFVAVAERLHMTRAAEDLHMTQSAVSAAITTLETRHGTKLFDRVGRGLALNATGKAFLPEAKDVLARAEAAQTLLDDLAGLKRGSVHIHASQTIAAYWLPQRMASFQEMHPDIDLHLSIGNTHRVIEAVLLGEAELGLVEGAEDAPLLERQTIGADRLVIAASPDHPLANRAFTPDVTTLSSLSWVLREEGSGTRSEFESALPKGMAREQLRISMVLPSNEAILTAVSASHLVTAISELAARPLIEAGRLVHLPLEMPERPFYLLRHKQRSLSRAASALATALQD